MLFFVILLFSTCSIFTYVLASLWAVLSVRPRKPHSHKWLELAPSPISPHEMTWYKRAIFSNNQRVQSRQQYLDIILKTTIWQERYHDKDSNNEKNHDNNKRRGRKKRSISTSALGIVWKLVRVKNWVGLRLIMAKTQYLVISLASANFWNKSVCDRQNRRLFTQKLVWAWQQFFLFPIKCRGGMTKIYLTRF